MWSAETLEGGAIPNGVTQMLQNEQRLNILWNRPAVFSDSGLYSCSASNRNGANTARLRLTVTCKLRLDYQVASILARSIKITKLNI